MSENSHPSDQELLRAADGELSSRGTARVRAHLAACWDCRARMAEMEETITDFARARRQALDAQLPPIDGPRALLRAHLAELATKSDAEPRARYFRLTLAQPVAACICAALLLTALGSGIVFQHYGVRGANSPAATVEPVSVPDRSLTPGATRKVAVSEVCSMPEEQVVRDVPASLRQKVLQEYGIANAHTDDYEIDFLIAPGLGGVEDIHNLWPEPHASVTWNSRVKDALEEQLHELVCQGNLDLTTAQREIATDWIAAYKKYFRTETPLSLRSDVPQIWPGRAWSSSLYAPTMQLASFARRMPDSLSR